MRIKIRNINKIQDANINLDGLTIITGDNNSGKSTVGKLLFLVVNAISNAYELTYQSKEDKKQESVDHLLDHTKDNFTENLVSEMGLVVESEFLGNVCSHGKKKASVSIDMDGENDSVEILFKDTKVFKIGVRGNDHLVDATYLESPLCLNILDTLYYAMTCKACQEEQNVSRDAVPTHWKDLASKLQALKIASANGEISQQLGLSLIMGGKFTFDNNSRTLGFVQDSTNLHIPPINVASGIKAFGLVQMLLDTFAIGNNKILIWDEPESHLHPKWQVNLAEVLVRLAKREIPVLVSTHSPYFLQGVRYCSTKHGMEKFTNYYYAEEQESHLSILKEVTHDLNSVFEKMAEPFRKIINLNAINRDRN